MEDKLKKRKPNRLKGFDYSRPNFYFVTLCTHDRQRIFGHIKNASLYSPQDIDKLAVTLLKETCQYYEVDLDEYIVMPDHIHIIVAFKKESKIDLSDFVKSFKRKFTSAYVKGVKVGKYLPYNEKIWQKSFHDRVIRDDDELNILRSYIRENIQRWEDKERFAKLPWEKDKGEV